MGWFKGKSMFFFPIKYGGFLVDCPLNQSNEPSYNVTPHEWHDWYCRITDVATQDLPPLKRQAVAVWCHHCVFFMTGSLKGRTLNHRFKGKNLQEPYDIYDFTHPQLSLFLMYFLQNFS